MIRQVVMVYSGDGSMPDHLHPGAREFIITLPQKIPGELHPFCHEQRGEGYRGQPLWSPDFIGERIYTDYDHD